MQSRLTEFLEYLESMVDRAIYVWGGQTQVISGGKAYKNDTLKSSLGEAEAWIKKVETSANNANRVLKLYKKRKDEFEVIPCVDCSGLGMNFLQNIKGYSKTDMTANGMKGKCTAIKASDLRKGDWVFRVYTSGTKKGRAHHIGYVVDDNLNVIESYGRDKGVIKRAFSSTYWNAYGRPCYFADEIEEIKTYRACFTKNLKKTSPLMRGDDVMALQLLLNEVNDAGLAVDGIFGVKTQKAVKDYQKTKKLTVDGIAGKKTIAALGGVWLEK